MAKKDKKHKKSSKAVEAKAEKKSKKSSKSGNGGNVDHPFRDGSGIRVVFDATIKGVKKSELEKLCKKHGVDFGRVFRLFKSGNIRDWKWKASYDDGKEKLTVSSPKKAA